MSEGRLEKKLLALEKRINELQAAGEAKFEQMEKIIGGQAVVLDAMSKVITSLSQDLGRQRTALLAMLGPNSRS